jgi:hypothetical protein
MSNNSLVVEELLIKSVEAQNRTTHAVRAFISFVLVQMVFGIVAAGLIWLATNANGSAVNVLMTVGISVSVFGLIFSLILAFYGLSQSGKGLKDDVTQYVDALDSVK